MNIYCFASDLLEYFFNKLNEKDISYVVLRNYRKLPEANESKDVDILIDPTKYDLTVQVLLNAAKDGKYHFIWENKLDYLHGFVFAKVSEGDIFSVKIDLFIGFLWRGLSYSDYNTVFENSISYNNFKIPSGSHQSYIMIMYYILYAKNINERYIQYIYEMAIGGLGDFRFLAQKTLSNNLVDLMINFIKGEKIIQLGKLRKKIIFELLFSQITKYWPIKSIFCHIWTESIVRNSFGELLAFSGPDGAGKTTLVNDIRALFYKLGIGDEKLYHFLSDSVPSIHQLPGIPKKYSAQDYAKPYQFNASGILLSYIRMCYYYFAFLMDRAFFLKPQLRGNKILIFDRYYTDIIADPKRFRIGLSKNTLYKFFKKLPYPNATFIILSKKSIILGRKRELKPLKIEELLEAYCSLSTKFPNCYIIYNNSELIKAKINIFKQLFIVLDKNKK